MPLTLPNADVPLGKCPHCGAEIKIEPIWYQRLVALLSFINKNVTP